MQKNLVKLEADQIDKVWNVCAPLLDKAIVYSEGGIDINDLYLILKERKQELWVLFGDTVDFVCTTRIVTYPQKTILEIPFAGARDANQVKDFKLIMDNLEEWGKAEGAEATVVPGRVGWTKIYPEFKLAYQVLIKEYEE
jgi:hypothetical protein